MFVIPFGHLIFNKLKRVYQVSERKTKPNHTETRRRSDAQATGIIPSLARRPRYADGTDGRGSAEPGQHGKTLDKDFMEVQNLEMSPGDGWVVAVEL